MSGDIVHHRYVYNKELRNITCVNIKISIKHEKHQVKTAIS